MIQNIVFNLKQSKTVAIVIFTVFIIFFLVGCGSEEESLTNNEEEKNIYNIGETFNVDELEFTVNGVEEKKKILGKWSEEVANGVFIVVDITAKNNGNEANGVSDSFFTLKIGDKEFKTSDDVIFELDDLLIFEDINPESSINFKIIFDISEEMANSDEIILQLEGEFWSEEKGLVKLK